MKSTGVIIDGVYYKNSPGTDMREMPTSMQKTWDHDLQREEHQVDIIQPYKDGKPNEDFIEMYPEQSELYGFIEKEQ